MKLDHNILCCLYFEAHFFCKSIMCSTCLQLHYPKVKGNRWYDVYVRKTPTDGRNSDAKDDLTKQSLQDSISLSLPASDSKSETDGDLQVSSEQPGKKIAEEDHPVTRHRSVASLSIQQVASLNPPEQSREAGQKSNEEVAAEDGCPANASHEVCGQSISTDENGVGQSYTAGSSYLRRRQKRLVDEELSASRRRSLAIDSAPHNLHHSRCSSPVRTSQRYTSSDASGQGQNHAAPNSPKTQRRRPRQYGTHRRRTWSHLLDKKPWMLYVDLRSTTKIDLTGSSRSKSYLIISWCTWVYCNLSKCHFQLGINVKVFVFRIMVAFSPQYLLARYFSQF